jgi:hypothetical protein
LGQSRMTGKATQWLMLWSSAMSTFRSIPSVSVCRRKTGIHKTSKINEMD